jgi:hypothetical protein
MRPERQDEANSLFSQYHESPQKRMTSIGVKFVSTEKRALIFIKGV